MERRVALLQLRRESGRVESARIAIVKAQRSGCIERLLAHAQTFFAEHGQLSPRDFRQHTQRMRAFLEMECGDDLRTLEAMWKYRDVIDVLISGCQGTAFEGTLWQMLDAEQARVAEVHREFQKAGLCRNDVPPELFGALVIGTYLLVGKKMARAPEKPDLALWARTLQQLIREGSIPRDDLATWFSSKTRRVTRWSRSFPRSAISPSR